VDRMDVIAIAIAAVSFLALLGTIELIDRI
jgi:hypothetical protein